MRSKVLAALAFAVLVSAAAGQASLEGQTAPEIQAKDFVHGDGRTTLADFRGQVVLLEFWKTRCGASRGEIRHLAKLADEFGRKGLEVIAVTSDDDRASLARFLTHADPSASYRIAIGGASGYAVTRLPCSVLIGPDGKVLVDAIAGKSMSDKDVESALKSVKPVTAEAEEARAAKRLAFAETFAASGSYARAEYELKALVKSLEGTPSAKSAAERLKSFEAPAVSAELDAQKDVAKLANLNATFEHAAEKPSAKEADSLAKRLAKKADELRAKTPRAAAMAEEWAAVYAEGWK
jgi:thiol-disulfide isomerase/thioredoxin